MVARRSPRTLSGTRTFLASSPPEAIARIQSILPELERVGPVPIVAVLHVTLARLHFAIGDASTSVALAKRAAELARSIDCPMILARAEVRRGAALLMLGEVSEAVNTLQEAVRLAEEVGEQATISDGLNNLAAAYNQSGDLTGSRRCTELMGAIEDRFGTDAARAWAELARGSEAHLAGEWQQALEHYRRSIDLYGAMPQSRFAPYATAGAGELLLQIGERVEGLRLVQTALAAMEEKGDTFGARRVRVVLAEHDLFEGRPDRAVERLDVFTQEADAENQDVTDLLPTMARAYLALGRVERAELLLDGGIERARGREQRMALAALLRARGSVMAYRQRWDAAECAFAEALALLEEMRYPWEIACTLHDRGVMEIRRGDARRALEYLSQAAERFRKLGARPYAERSRATAEGVGFSSPK
jgi:tetratricopeptide (TPR) repeat protein